VEICEFPIYGLIMKICDSGMTPRICGFAICLPMPTPGKDWLTNK
jgi:hypothetical protein